MDDISYSISKFCEIEDISVSTFHKLQRMGKGPRTGRIPGTNIVRISAAARAKWHQMIDGLQAEPVAVEEKERRKAQAVRAGKAAAESPRHVSNTRRRT
jgi:hypothetical protein